MPPIDENRADEPVEYEFPVSPAQGRLLVLGRMHPGSTQYHVPAAFAVHGPFDTAAFIRALDALVARHESLRTVFRPDGGEYVQVVAAEARADVRIEHGTEPGDVHAALLADAARPFDVENGPLLRCTIHHVSDGSHRILLTLHHLICDGWSLRIILQELADSYRAGTGGPPPTAEPLPIQYPDYAAWQSRQLDEDGYAQAVGHWRDSLCGAPTLLDLPLDRPRPAVQTTEGSVEQFVLDTDTRARLAKVAQERDTTSFMALFAAFTAFLSRLCDQEDLVVGVPVAGRDNPDLHGMVGLLTNTLAVRGDLSGDPSYALLLDRTRTSMRAALPHQEAPFSAVVDAMAPERELSHDPVLQVVFSYDDDTELGLALPGARVERIELRENTAKFDLMMYVHRWGPELVVQFIHRTGLLDPVTVRHWVRAFRALLDRLLDRPHAPLSTADLLDAEERHRILRTWNRTEDPAPDELVPDLVARHAAERPDATALVCGETVVSYRELLTRADRLAAALRDAGVGPEVPVGLCLPRSVENAVAALAVLRAGGAYVPLDPEQPPARLAHMVADAGARLILATAATAERTKPLDVPTALLADGAPDFASPVPVVGHRPTTRPGPRTTAYVLFTSGSTGTPKGVAVEHRAFTNLATVVRPSFPVTADDRVLQYVSAGFDVAVSDLFFTMAAGAELHIAGEQERLGDALFTRLSDSRITYVFLPPAAAMSLPCPPGALPELRTLAVGGEACPPELVDRWATPGRRVVNAYGPSEVTVYATTADLLPGEPVVVGRPVANVGVYVLDRLLRPVPVGVPGEIYVAGPGLARGYAGRPGLTAERFTADPFGPPGSRMYRSGDLGRFDAGGSVAILGRTDTQVKVRGFRVELGEIETVLASHPGVSVAAATVLGDAADRRLAAYVVGAGASPPGAGELRAHLAERLPSYMVPETFVHLDELPVNRSGKVVRSRLPEPSADRPELGHPYVAPATATERRLAGVWSQVLGIDRVGVHDNFFDLGGNSIRMLAVLTALREQDGPGSDDGLALVDLFRHPNVAALSARMDRPSGAEAPAADRDSAQRHGRDRRARLAARTAARTAGRATRTDSEEGSSHD